MKDYRIIKREVLKIFMKSEAVNKINFYRMHILTDSVCLKGVESIHIDRIHGPNTKT